VTDNDQAPSTEKVGDGRLKSRRQEALLFSIIPEDFVSIFTFGPNSLLPNPPELDDCGCVATPHRKNRPATGSA
jgi:hypothetical protein